MKTHTLSFSHSLTLLPNKPSLNALQREGSLCRSRPSSQLLRRGPRGDHRKYVKSSDLDGTPRSKAKSAPAATESSNSTVTQCEPAQNLTSTPLYDVIVIGAGPSGLSLSAALSTRKLDVCCIDGTINRAWPNHYGVWRDEFKKVGFEDCATAEYNTTVVYAGNANSDKIELDRNYIRVDRVKLKSRLFDQCRKNSVTFLQRNVDQVDHVCPSWSSVSLAGISNSLTDEENRGKLKDEEVDNNHAGVDSLRARLIVDCTGHAVAFTSTGKNCESNSPIWYQAAYGIEAEVVSYPYEKDEMMLMDFRDKHMTGADRQASERQPTFLYVFPMSERRAFFEETSVIQREAVSFTELKARLYRRLKHDGVKVVRVIEEERSLIPMGGQLPDLKQRVIAFGGAALLVHPATGYMVGRTMCLAQQVAERMKQGLDRIGEQGEVLEVVRDCWDELWGVSARRQRDFLMFGAELLESLNMEESRSFFHAFFKLPDDLWIRFLSYDLDGPLLRAQFAFTFFLVANNAIRLRLLSAMVQHGRWKLIRSILPEWLTAETY